MLSTVAVALHVDFGEWVLVLDPHAAALSWITEISAKNETELVVLYEIS